MAEEKRWSDRLREGVKLPRRLWPIHPRTKVVPPKRGRKAPYKRKARRKGEDTV